MAVKALTPSQHHPHRRCFTLDDLDLLCSPDVQDVTQYCALQVKLHKCITTRETIKALLNTIDNNSELNALFQRVPRFSSQGLLYSCYSCSRWRLSSRDPVRGKPVAICLPNSHRCFCLDPLQAHLPTSLRETHLEFKITISQLSPQILST